MKYIAGEKTWWIWRASDQEEKKADCQVVYFRKTFFVPDAPVQLKFIVSAESKYRLFLNGHMLAYGPCKGSRGLRYYDTVDAAGYLRPGKNVLAAKVIHLPCISLGNTGRYEWASYFRYPTGGFMLDGVLMSAEGTVLEDISTNDSWRVKEERGISFLAPVYGAYATAYERVSQECLFDWNLPQLEDSQWEKAAPVSPTFLTDNLASAYGETNEWRLTRRPIPPMYESPGRFVGVTNTDCAQGEVQRLILGKPIQLLPHKRYFMELDAGELTTAFLEVKASGGKGSEIKVLYAECYEQKQGEIYRKERRDDASGVLRGDYDLFLPGGDSSLFEPLFFRTFRYVRLEIITAQEALQLSDICFRETGYPLKIEGAFASSDPYGKQLWEISVRTLRRCMHETFFDCPYYEQLQYIMDTRAQSLYSYQISRDDRLARKAMEEFHCSKTPEGILQSRYPSAVEQVIPGFSLYWIFMLEDHLMYFGDLSLICGYRPTVDAILDWFGQRLEHGLVKPLDYWPFVDWVDGWEQNSVPPAHRHGPVTVDSLMYAKALQSAARLFEATGRRGMAEEYVSRAEFVLEAVRQRCWDHKKECFLDGPGVYEYSQHAQVWAVLSGAVKGAEAKALMERTLLMEGAKVSYAAAFYLFRALEQTGLYDRHAGEVWEPWRRLCDLGVTTWVEDPVTQRSECHGWGALALYEYEAVVLGVRPGAEGYASIAVCPHPGALEYARGVVPTVHGNVKVEWKRQDAVFFIEVCGPEEVPLEVQLPDGAKKQAIKGKLTAVCGLEAI